MSTPVAGVPPVLPVTVQEEASNTDGLMETESVEPEPAVWTMPTPVTLKAPLEGAADPEFPFTLLTVPVWKGV